MHKQGIANRSLPFQSVKLFYSWGMFNFVYINIVTMDNCFICGRECHNGFWKTQVYFKGVGLVDSVTGEKYNLCSQCAGEIHRGAFRDGRITQVLLNLKHNGVRGTIRALKEINKIPQAYARLDYLHSQTVRILTQKYLENCTGFLVFNIDQYLLFDEVNRQMLLNASSVCSFDEVIDYKVLDHSVDFNVHSPESTEYYTQSKNALGRAVLGKVFAGSTGALVGGLTAKHNLSVQKSGYSTYTTTSHDYSIVIRLKKLGNNSVVLSIGESEEEMNTLCNALDTIISLKR